MFNFFKKVYHFQVNQFKENDYRIVRLANLLCFLAVFISSLYSLFYYVILDSTKAALVNEFFALCYLGYFYFLSRGKLFPALLSITITFLCQMFFVVVFFVSNKSGFHYYYFLAGPTLYIFFKDEKKNYRIGFSIVAFILFLICEMIGGKYSDFNLSDMHFRILYFSTMGIAFYLLLAITHTFKKEIDAREAQLEKASGDLVLTNIELERENSYRKQAQGALEEEKIKLQQALLEIKQLSGLLPICAACKKIRDDKGYWSQIETYISKHSEAEFSHGICPECRNQLYPDLYDDLKDEG